MRTAFITHLIDLARENDKIFLVVGDLGFSVVEPFAEEFPDRFINAGVAEQNMTGVAAGLASEGFHVFTYSIANFPTLRCLEQIRNDVCYHDLPVTVVAVGGGLGYGNLGYSHHGVQDLAIMRTLPNITVLAPGDPGETRQSLDYLVNNPGPSYLRLGKAGEVDVHNKEIDFDKGLVQVYVGSDGDAIVTTGSALSVGMESVKALKALGRDPSLFSCPLIEPLATNQFMPLNNFVRVVSIEDHINCGGLGEIIRSYISSRIDCYNLSVPKNDCGLVGTELWLRGRYGISVEKVLSILGK